MDSRSQGVKDSSEMIKEFQCDKKSELYAMILQILNRYHILFLFVILVCLIGCKEKIETNGAGISGGQAPNDYTKTLVALGDSLTAGLGVDADQTYPAQLERKLTADGYSIKVINAGISGETSSGTLTRIHWVISSLKPDFILLVIGANDGMRGIDIHYLEDNLDRIISIIKESNIPVLIGGMQMLPNLGPAYARAFEEVYPKIAQRHDVMLIPFFLEGVAGEKKFNQRDGIHPTAEGYAMIVEHIYPYVLELINASS